MRFSPSFVLALFAGGCTGALTVGDGNSAQQCGGVTCAGDQICVQGTCQPPPTDGLQGQLPDGGPGDMVSQPYDGNPWPPPDGNSWPPPHDGGIVDLAGQGDGNTPWPPDAWWPPPYDAGADGWSPPPPYDGGPVDMTGQPYDGMTWPPPDGNPWPPPYDGGPVDLAFKG
jgi:hypothetical protein